MNISSTVDDHTFIWATRGRTWGFRFLRSGRFEDPLGVYESAFAELEGQTEAWARLADKVALRFPDPEGRQDAAGRVIPHDFVLIGSWADGISSLEDGRRVVWPLVADDFAESWDRPEPPSVAD